MGFLAAALFLVVLATLQVSSQEFTCQESVDLLFVIDASGSVGFQDFQKQLDFVSALVAKFSFGPAKFSVLRFDSFPNITISFGDYQDVTSLRNAITNITYPGGGTDTAAALKLVREQAFKRVHGARAGVPKAAIVSTDGMSNNPLETKVQAGLLPASEVLVLAVGVGSNYNLGELQDIGTFSSDIYKVQNYNTLVSIINEYSKLVCDAVKLFQCNNEADIFILLDSSIQIDQNSLQSLLPLVRNLSSTVNPTTNKFGLILFGTSVQLVFNLKQIISDNDLAKALSAASPVQGVTDLDQVLRYVRDQAVFDTSVGGRDNATKILVLLTNGEPGSGSQAARNTASQLRQSGINLLAMGVSSPNLSQLQELVNDPVLDVIPDLASSSAIFNRIKTLTALEECRLPQYGVKEINESDYCRFYNWENGIHAHPRNCTKFIQCTFLKTDVMNCPAGLGYDPDLQACNYINQVPACYNPPPVPTPPPQPVTQPPRSIIDICETYGLAYGLYPDPSDCHKFIQCVQSKTYSFVCPSGLNYNHAKTYCDDVHVIDCQVNYRFFDNMIAG